MLTHLDPASALAVGLLVFALIMVVIFEATNGFHDAANAVATVIYTNSLQPVQAVVWSGIMNFVGVLVGGIAVAYALVELLPAEVLSPPDGGPAVAMLLALFIAALIWNIGTWWFGLPNSSSHCLIGALIGVAIGNALVRGRSLSDGVHWHQLWTVLEGLALSPLLGFVLAGGLYLVTRKTIHDRHLYEPIGEKAPVWWMRTLLIGTCSAVSFAHGTNDGQKSIGMIMLTIIGLFPAIYALNPTAGQALNDLPSVLTQAAPLVRAHGDDEKGTALKSIDASIAQLKASGGANRVASLGVAENGGPAGLEFGSPSDVSRQRSQLRDNIYQVISQLKHVTESDGLNKEDKSLAKELAKKLGTSVEYAPLWVRMLSAICLGVGTMFGYRRIVVTLGERLGHMHMTPAQGASAEVVASILIGIAGFTGLPVSTTHIVTSGIGGTMVTAGSGLRYGMVSRIVSAWLFTLPVTIALAAGIYYLLASPGVAN
jgi:PiT family inorganic phosphate transporter